jgi:ABC-type transporter Mla subunit MlaD
MADAVGIITKIIEAALKIKRAADTVKQNEDLCKKIIRRAKILSDTLSQHQDNRELMNNLAVTAALEALDETLGEALKLVMDCQEETKRRVPFLQLRETVPAVKGGGSAYIQ